MDTDVEKRRIMKSVKTAIYVSSMKSHFDGLGTDYDPAEITAFVKEKMQALENAGAKFPK